MTSEEFFYNVPVGSAARYSRPTLSIMHQLFVIARREAHSVTRVAFIEEICFTQQKVEERFDKSFDASDFLADSEIKFVESV